MKFKTKLCLIALAGGGLSLGCFLYEFMNREPLVYLLRPGSGSGDEKTELMVDLEGDTYPFTIILKEVPYSEEEVIVKLQEAFEGLEEVFLQDNKDLEHVVQDVCMPSVYPGSQVTIQWYPDSWDYINPDGTVGNESLKTAVSVEIQAVLSLENESIIWKRQMVLCPMVNPDVSQKLQILEYELLEAQEERNDRVVLPDMVFAEPIVWYQKADDRWFWMLALTILALAAVAAGQRKEAQAGRKKTERSMQLDYPEIVSRLSLYMGAGISTRKAWERIVDHYEKKELSDKERHVAYEEMRITLHEMQSGIAESLAYERFGTRCRMPSYLKLGTLLSQNLRKGTKNLADLLKEESGEAFENRKALAKKIGEECESRLLLPMLMMLLTVLIIIMYPAVVSFQM